MTIKLYTIDQAQPATEGWLISAWDAGQPYTLSDWEPSNVTSAPNGTVLLTLDRAPSGNHDQPYDGAEIQSSVTAATGTWTWNAKAPGMIPGTVFGMFLYQADWQDARLEFDMEIVGDDPTRIELVTHMAMADGRTKTAVQYVKLGFDPSAGFHQYEISLDGNSAIFRIDGATVATFDKGDFEGYWKTGEVRAYTDLWATGASNWAGTLDPDTLPVRAEVLSAGWSPDVIQPDNWLGTAGADRHRGTDLNDRLNGKGGADQIYGEAGADQIHGDAGDDVLHGWTGADRISGGTGRDRIYGEVGRDLVFGGAGDDVLSGGAGKDHLEGGLGRDTYLVSETGDKIVELSGQGIDTVRSSVSYTLGANLENLALLGSGNLSGTGNGLANRLTGNGAANVLSGGVGIDVLQGKAGADRLIGGAGKDTAVGGAGNDSFQFNSRADVGDRIADFSNISGNNDVFRISTAGFGGNFVAGRTLAASQFQVRGDNLAQDSNDRFIFRTTDATLWFDSNGRAAGGLTLVADLQAGAVVTAADILLI